jgi:Protein of unknown function (DUF4232)
MHSRRVWPALATVLFGGVLAAACSSSPSPSHPTTTTTTAVHRTTTTTTAVSPTTASTTTTTGIAACAQVSGTPGQIQGAAGTIIGTITLSEVGTGTCTINGYPTLVRFNSSGTTVVTTMVHGLTVNQSGPASQPPSLVTLTPTQNAEFTFQYSDVVTGSETSCAVSSSLTVTTPGATSASAPITLSISACNTGTVEVSPVYAAS